MEMKKTVSRLNRNRESVRELTSTELPGANGGMSLTVNIDATDGPAWTAATTTFIFVSAEVGGC
jgi:hypothetical protein